MGNWMSKNWSIVPPQISYFRHVTYNEAMHFEQVREKIRFICRQDKRAIAQQASRIARLIVQADEL